MKDKSKPIKPTDTKKAAPPKQNIPPMANLREAMMGKNRGKR